MPGMFHGIYSVSQALRNFQRALDTTGHNVANVNTPGYSRQRAEFIQNQPIGFWSNGYNALGSGASIGAIDRIRDVFLDRRQRDNSSDLGRYRTLAQSLNEVESIIGEPSETGISAALDRFFNAWSGLGARPYDDAARTEVRLAGQILSDRVRNAYTRMDAAQSQFGGRIDATLSEIDRIGEAIAKLNNGIRTQESGGGAAPDLRDQRDAMVSQLSKLINVDVHENPDGAYQVYAGEHLLVDSAGTRPIPKSFDYVTGTLSDGTRTYQVASGELAGRLQAANTIESFQSRLDELANALRTEINTSHQTGINAQGNTGVSFFTDTAGGAIDFDLSVEVKASADAIAAGTSGDEGDGSLANMFASLRDSAVGSLGGQTFYDFHLGSVDLIASESNYFADAATTQEAIGVQIENQIQAVSGVNLDEEMAEMMRFQRSYQAAARTLTVIDQMTEDLIGMLRR